MQKTIYVPDEDLELWEKFAESANLEQRSVSFMLGVLVRGYLVERGLAEQPR